MTFIKQLEIHGFKSFARPTTFVFDHGITSIIGPNGSGKSNVAEALRWVLGEQQYSNLRGRRTEDVIFAGSDRRSQLGMAEVAVTLDNSDGGLPLEFEEITIARRAYRSGENQYLINGSRVRLKDVQQLTAPLGQAHVIIGQGLVDAVLSQRPEDRRGLFEHAAGITGLRVRATNAERELAEAAGNAGRLRDILAELEPRVRSLARSAKQAREYESVRNQLQELQRGYFGALWRTSRQRIAGAQAALDEADTRLTDGEARHQEGARQLASLRGRERQLAGRSRDLAETLAGHERDLADARHRLELFDAEMRSAAQRLEDLQTAKSELESSQADQQADVERLDAETATLQDELTALEERRITLETETETARRGRAAIEQEIAQVDRRLLDLSRRIAETEGNFNSLQQQRQALISEQEQLDSNRSSEEQQQSDLEMALAELDASGGDLERETQGAADDLVTKEQDLSRLRAAIGETEQAAEDVKRDLSRLRSEYDLLERAHEEGEGFYAGVRTLLQAVRRGKLEMPGLHGTVAELVTVPKEYETAIEVALGGHLQDVIVERWSDAEAAIEYLKRSRSGRATFQPLDTISRPRSRSLDIDDPGITGVASELVTYPAEIAPVVKQLLDRTIVVADLQVTRRVLDQGRGWTVVTLDGEITRPSGSVTGGARGRSSGLLAGERKRRSMPDQISGKERELAVHQTKLEQQQQSLADLATDVEAARTRVDDLRERQREHEAERSRLQRELLTVTEHLEQRAQQRRALGTRREDLDASLNRARQHLGELTGERDRAQEQLTMLDARLAKTQDAGDEVLPSLVAEIAAMKERLGGLERERDAASRQVQGIGQTITTRTTEIERLAGEQSGRDERRETIQEAIRQLESRIEEDRAAAGPIDQERAGIAGQIEEAERSADGLIEEVRETERERDRAALELARARDEQSFLRERIRDELDNDEPNELVEEAGETGEEVEQKIRRLRERLRRMSTVSKDVVTEYEEESARLEYLTGQLQDVESAAESLRGVLRDLHQKMSASFNETFHEVAAEFERTFKRLFGGGTAKLSHEGEEDEAGGIAIVARPPGKRLQGLNQLSGGERALTAVSLLLAIQRVNPSPFCLLDEVDAALDEGNVVRFREEVRDLASNTQYIVITHNRGTIEGADTLYGVTMGEDSVSRVVSLRLDQAIRTVEEQEEFESVI